MTTREEGTGGYRGYGVRIHPTLGVRKPLPAPVPEHITHWFAWAEQELYQPFVGVTTEGLPRTGLFELQRTGVSTRPIKDAADAWLARLTFAQRAMACLQIDDVGWRRPFNPEHNGIRHGILLNDASPSQRESTLDLLKATLSERGFETVQNVMRLNETLREITGDLESLGQWQYFMSIFGVPSMDEPWGWQLDGHHLIVNCFVLNDQVVLTPCLLGAEPTIADAGTYAGTRIFDAEQERGLAAVRALPHEQRTKAILFPSMLTKDLPPERIHFADWRIQAGSFADNAMIPYEGIRATEMSPAQRELLVDLLALHVGLLRNGHARVKLDEVRRHLDETYFAWIGTVDDVNPFYYKVHSPVIIVEFDHHPGLFLDNDEPERFHGHLVIRTPNGNDYGRDLLRQHHARSDHAHHGDLPH